MSHDDKQREEHLHGDQDDVGSHEQPFGEQAGPGDSQGDTGEGDKHGTSASEPFGHDEEGPEEGVKVEGETGGGETDDG